MNGPFTLRHPLDGAVSASTARSADHVTILPAPLVLTVATLPGEEQAAEALLGFLPGMSLRAVGPGEWLVVAERQDQSLSGAVFEKVAGLALVTDQSSGRAVMRLAGPNSRTILSRLVPLDLDPGVFAVGASGNCFLAHVSANVARIGDDEFEISVMRSFALTAFEELMEAGLEFRLTAGFAT